MNEKIIGFGIIFICFSIIIFLLISSGEMTEQANKICQEKGFLRANELNYNFLDGLIFKFNPTRLTCAGNINDCIIGCETK